MVVSSYLPLPEGFEDPRGIIEDSKSQSFRVIIYPATHGYTSYTCHGPTMEIGNR